MLRHDDVSFESPVVRQSLMPIKIGFIGLGAMGKPIAVNIVKAGFDLTVYDLREEPCQELATLGAKVASSARQVAELSEIVEVIVVDDDQTEQVIAGELGVIHGATPGLIVALHSTLLPATVRKLAALCRDKGIEVIDAPVSGGQKGAEDRQLCYMVGGEAKVLEKCRPVFETSASHIFHLGELGTGALAKMLIQVVVGLNMIAAHECEVLCDKTRLDFKSLQEVLHVSAGQSFVLDHWLGRFKRPGEPEEVRQQRLEVFSKSLVPALELAREVGVSLPGTALAHDLIKGVMDID
ncbi:MAG TPA: NAD(P)-dependent oxidoreductase [Candidatus Limnocylindria bacterium]|nr:NAD(P)-dependent oxidoreductase [Candidatus Limnocylindria bacterium]